jgi:Zn-dependent oligopeptidase
MWTTHSKKQCVLNFALLFLISNALVFDTSKNTTSFFTLFSRFLIHGLKLKLKSILETNVDVVDEVGDQQLTLTKSILRTDLNSQGQELGNIWLSYRFIVSTHNNIYLFFLDEKIFVYWFNSILLDMCGE